MYVAWAGLRRQHIVDEVVVTQVHPGPPAASRQGGRIVVVMVGLMFSTAALRVDAPV